VLNLILLEKDLFFNALNVNNYFHIEYFVNDIGNAFRNNILFMENNINSERSSDISDDLSSRNTWTKSSLDGNVESKIEESYSDKKTDNLLNEEDNKKRSCYSQKRKIKALKYELEFIDDELEMENETIKGIEEELKNKKNNKRELNIDDSDSDQHWLERRKEIRNLIIERYKDVQSKLFEERRKYKK
jgi:hypothetical protein